MHSNILVFAFFAEFALDDLVRVIAVSQLEPRKIQIVLN